MEIPLTKGLTAIVDAADYEALSKFKWFANRGYAARNSSPEETGGVRRTVRMHRQILGLGRGEIADHINRNKTDNRRKNLRVCTQQQNCCNRSARQKSVEGFKGIYQRPSGKYVATVRHKRIGIYESAVEAAEAYDYEARQLFGEFAGLNFPDRAIIKPPRIAKRKTSSGYRGVYLTPAGNAFQATCMRKYLGTFADPVEAAKAYDLAAVAAFGDRARLNFPEALAAK